MSAVVALNDDRRSPAERLAAMPPSVVKILAGAIAMLPRRGTRRLSMSDICDASGVSRGTLYKYFANKDEVLEAVSEYVSTRFENGVREVAQGIDDPVLRLKTVLEYQSRFTREEEGDRLLLVEPEFFVTFFQTHFQRHSDAMRDALDPSFDHFDRTLGHPLDRDALCKMFVRISLSTAIIPAEQKLTDLPALFTDLVTTLIAASPVHRGE